ncbi:MAG: hypothetical protein REI12_05160 [Pedobacter sp.]|nr:hypothetical protein [Pedobacter sp.]
MKRILCTASLLLAAAPLMAADVGVSVSVGQPGFYGTIDISNYPRPQVIYAEPVVVRPVPVGVVYEPVYLHVPPGQAKKWSKHCGAYNACGRPVYFVRDDWYNDTYVPAYRERHPGKGHGNKHKGHGKGHD